jgi:hypothetical protein
MVWQNGYDTAKKELQRENERLRAANAEADSIIEKHIIRLARYFWSNGGHIETFANEARAALATAKEAAPDG